MQLGGTYRIEVAGEVDDSLLTHLGTAVVRRVDASTACPVSILEIRVQSQAALSAVLDALYGLHLPVSSVELLRE